MYWSSLIILGAIFCSVVTEPEPKKYKNEKNKKETNEDLTMAERTFLREVEAEFGIKSDVNEPEKTSDIKEKLFINPKFPAVIAIEIVNDTETKDKGKRTIDANLGYGYRTNNGYSYNYFGKPLQEKGRFMIYPYSQHDIPPVRSSQNRHHEEYYHRNSKHRDSGSSHVEIQPSKAYELIPVDAGSQYDKTQNYEAPPPPPYRPPNPSATLYTTYNGQKFSNLQGTFPMVKPNYLVEPAQLLKDSLYQGVGLTDEHLKAHGAHSEQKVVPVLVLRIPSSYLKNPSAELYPNLPHNYPLSQYLNHVNLQDLVNKYFKEMGFSYAPTIMTYKKHENEQTVPTAAESYDPQPAPHYANPYVDPAYTHADYSGVQYSAVQPVMAKYPTYENPSSYVQQTQPQYESQNKQYNYKYVMPEPGQDSHYYVEENSAQVPYLASDGDSTTTQEEHIQIDTNAHIGSIAQDNVVSTVINSEPYNTYPQGSVRYSSNSGKSESDQIHQEYGLPPSAAAISSVLETQHHSDSGSVVNQQYQESDSNSNYVPKETIAFYQSNTKPSSTKSSSHYDSAIGQTQPKYNYNDDSQTIVISENYPSKDHTQAHVEPKKYKPKYGHGGSSIQYVKYVTPMPYVTKYQSQYQVMVPQINVAPNAESSYVNSHSPQPYDPTKINSSYSTIEEYTAPAPKTPNSSRHYHSHPKRIARHRPVTHSSTKQSSSKREKTNSTETKRKESITKQ